MVWISEAKGGRKKPPSAGRYYSVSRFPEDVDWQNNAWSVVFDLFDPCQSNGEVVSFGEVDFLVNNAPKERVLNHKIFDIYEGPKKVAEVTVLD
ncbi:MULTISPECIES: hypothetical protein [unclassified Burkholderia]|uniref:hypothetical protein n=1 Tax=unclassified Burkholderia TaxID=2613784 RepID=UPI001C8A2C6D|nr:MULTISPECIES: hypothetical protein [unclassified Burkholderia]